jgi:outer membrane lipoprotein-sorting protein
MNRRVSITAAVILGAFSMAWSQKSRLEMGEFSATITSTVAGNTSVGKIFVSKNKMRNENVTGDRKGASIIRMDKGVTWVLMENKQYMEMTGMNNKDLKLLEKESEQKFIIKSLGKEKVNGYLCEKKRYTDRKGEYGVTTIWYSPKLKYMVKNEHSKDGKVNLTMVLSDIKTGKQPASLFEVPSGYTLFDPMSQVPPEMRGMMKGMMKGMPKGMLKGMMKDGMPENMGNEGAED